MADNALKLSEISRACTAPDGNTRFVVTSNGGSNTAQTAYVTITNLLGNAVVAAANTVAANDKVIITSNGVPHAILVTDLLASGGGGSVNAASVTYDDALSLFGGATDVQDAIINARLYQFPNPIQVSAGYDVVQNGFGKFFELDSATAQNINVPQNDSVPITTGSKYRFMAIGDGPFTFVPAGGVTLISKSGHLVLNGKGSWAELYKQDTDVWVVYGDLTAS